MARSSRRRVLVALALSLPVPALVACQGLIGLDDFQKGECPGAHCGDSGTGETFVPDSPFNETGGGDTGPGTSPVAWAKWRMPNYDAGTPDVENPLQYDSGAPNTVTDVVTGLVWLDVSIGNFTYDQAVDACDKQQNGGRWRLPKRIELVSLLDFAPKSSTDALWNPAFKQNAAAVYWTSSEVRNVPPTPDMYWTISFETGTVQPKSKDQQALVRCVRGDK
jgi:hypothetical protein